MNCMEYSSIYAFDIDTLQWTRVNDPSPRLDSSGSIEGSGYYPDASGNPDLQQPRSRHSYWYQVCVPPIDRYCSIGASYTYPNSRSSGHVDCFDFITNRWEQKRDAMTFDGMTTATYDPATHHVFVHGRQWSSTSGFLAEWDPVTDTWTRRSNAPSGVKEYAAPALDTRRHQLAFLALYGGELMMKASCSGEKNFWKRGSHSFCRLPVFLSFLLFLLTQPLFPAVASGSSVTSLQLTSGVSGTLPFTVGLGFKKGDVPDVLTLDVSTSQVIVKSRWSDNSVKHAIASGRVTLTAGTPRMINVLSSSSVSGTHLTAADIQTANPSASVQLGSIGTVNLSSLLAAPFRTWISGPEMVEAHYRSAVGSDPTLVVWFYVRLYMGGQMWIRAVVENGYLDVNTGNKSYVPTVTIGGTAVYNNGGAALSHYAHTRWTVEGWIGTSDPQITSKLDTTYLMDSKLVPNYWKRNPSATALNSLVQAYTPMQRGGWTQHMGDTGYQEQIGLLPLWDALYVSSGGDARAYKSVLANAKSLNSYPIVWNDSATKLPTIPSGRPTWTIEGPNGGGATIYNAGDLSWDVAHHGSGGYLAYLITGDYYFLETMQDQSTLCYLIQSSSQGSGTSRILGGQTRGVAWCTRTIGQLVGIGPADSIGNDYRTLLVNNVARWGGEVQRPGQNLIGYLYSYEISSGSYGVGAVSPWQQHFWVQTYGHLSDLEPLSDMTPLNNVRNFLYKSVVGILGPSGTDNYCYSQASVYTLNISSSNNADPTTWYDSWGQVYQATNGTANTSCGTTLGGGSGGAPSSASMGYWGNLMPGIAYAVDHGAPGASAAWARLTGATNWTIIEQSGFDDTPNWGIVPRTTGAVSSPPAAPRNLRTR